jgi:hypothetical protein
VAVDRPRAHRTAKIALDDGDALVHRFATPTPGRPLSTDAARAAIEAAVASGPRALVVAVARPDRRADLAAVVASAGGVAITVECEAAGLDAPTIAALLAAGVTAVRVVHGGMRERVYETVMRAPGTWRAAAAGVAAAMDQRRWRSSW